MTIGMNTGLEGKRTLHDTAIFEKEILSNGVTIWLQKSPIQFDRRGIIMTCLPNVGSICDPPDAPGTAHFFEHAPFLGTKNKPYSKAIWEPIEDLSGGLNAATSHTWIRYDCSLPEDQFRLATETIFELTSQPLFRDEDIITERGTILAEWRRGQANGDKVAGEAAMKKFWNNHPFGNPILGYPESISAMTAGMLRSFFEQHFTSGNLHVVLGGTFAKQEVLSFVKDLFDALPQKSAEPVAEIAIPVWQGRREITVNPAFRRDHLIMIWVLKGDSLLAGQRIMNYLAGDMTSPLIALLRGKMGAIYENGLGSASLLHGDTSVSMAIPVAAEHFSFTENAVYEKLGDITPDDIIRQQRIAQHNRDYRCPHPIDVARNAVADLVLYSEIPSLHTKEEKSDRLTVAEVLAVRDLLLKTTPFICETRAA